MSVLPPEYSSTSLPPDWAPLVTGPAESLWPHPFDIWGTDYPTGRGVTRATTGWCCPSCSRAFSPAVRECPYCPEKPAQATAGVSRRLGPGDEITDEDAER